MLSLLFNQRTKFSDLVHAQQKQAEIYVASSKRTVARAYLRAHTHTRIQTQNINKLSKLLLERANTTTNSFGLLVVFLGLTIFMFEQVNMCALSHMHNWEKGGSLHLFMRCRAIWWQTFILFAGFFALAHFFGA